MKQLISFGLSLCLGLGFVACSSDSSSGNGGGNSPADVVGEWNGTASDTTFSYVFNAGGTGTYTESRVVSKADGTATTITSFTYTKTSDTEGSIEFASIPGASEGKLTATFTISGKSMTVKRSDGLTQSAAKKITTTTGGDQPTTSGDSKGKGSMTINGTTFNATYGFYTIDEGDLMLYFYNCDLPTLEKTRDASKLPEKVDNIVIVLFGAGKQGNTIPTGSYSKYVVLAATGSKQELMNGGDFGLQYTSYGEQPGGNVTIAKNGNNYTVSFGALNYVKPMAGNDKTQYKGSAFSYTGGFAYNYMAVD